MSDKIINSKATEQQKTIDMARDVIKKANRSFDAINIGCQADLALGLCEKGFDLKQGIIIAATSCEACMNVLAHEVGLNWGYAEGSEDHMKCGTRCHYCNGEGFRVVNSGIGEGVRTVLNKIIKRIRDKGLAKEMGQKVLDYAKTKNDRADLTNQDARMLYRPDDYGTQGQLSKKKKIDIGWTDHAEYRSDLRDIDPNKANRGLLQVLKGIMQPQKGKKPNLNPSQPRRLKVPGLGTMVVDYNLQMNPADARIITLWASTSPRPDCADCVRKHLAQAAALIQESLQGYPDHFWLAIGHLAEAEAEAQGRWPDFAKKLRAERKKMETRDYVPDCVALIKEVTEMVKNKHKDKLSEIEPYVGRISRFVK